MSQEGAEAEGRSKRQAKAPVWVQEGINIDDALAGEMAEEQPQKYVFKLLQKEDINRALVGRQVFVFWEDYDLWYRGKIKKIDFETLQAVIFYPDTEEEEPDADLGALANAKQVAFKESRPLDHQLGLNEVEHSKEFAAAEKRKRGRPPKGQERPRDPNTADDGVYYDDFDDDEEPAPEESDPSYDGRGRKRGKGEGGVDSKRNARAGGGARGKYDEEDEEAEGQRLLARAQGGPARPAGLQDDAAVRDKVRNAFTQVLEQAKVEQAPPAPMNPMVGGMPGSMPFNISPALAAQMMAASAAGMPFMAPQMGAAPGGVVGPQPGAGMPMNPMGMAGLQMPMAMNAPIALPAMVAPPLVPGAVPPPVAPAPVAEPIVAAPPAPPAAEEPAAPAPEAAPAAEAEPAVELPKPAVVANVVEDELVRMYGGTTKEYKEKSRTLVFNLKGNKELRAHVLRGDITPAAFVRMTATELANKELAAYRMKKEEEALKMSVLDAEAAAKFSTAAALDARDTLALPAAIVTDKLLAAREKETAEGETNDGEDADALSPTRHGSGGAMFSSGSPRGAAGGKLSSPSGHSGDHDAHDHERGPSTASKSEAPAAPAVAIDYASVKAQAVQTNNSLPQRLDSDISQKLEPFSGGSGGLERSPASGGGGGGGGNGGSEERKHKIKLPAVENLTRVFLPARSLSTLRPNIWSGSIVVPGTGEYTFTADALAGGHDLAALLGPAKLQVRGRLSISNLIKFLCELHLSKHRLAMLGVLRPLPTAEPMDRESIKSLVSSYVGQSRAGVGEPHKGVEVYLIPPGDLASRLLEAGQEVEREVAAGGAVARGVSVPTTLLEDQMVAMVVYKKDVKVPPALSNMAMMTSSGMHTSSRYPPQSTLPMVSAAAAAAAGGGGGGGYGAPGVVGAPPPYSAMPGMAPLPMVGAGQMPMQQQHPPPPASGGASENLPTGLDFSAISALAAAFGVAPQQPDGQGPPPQ
ncbi:putative PHD finger protein 3 [Nannochloris sp. 'desiccata']|nr:putative PHD finger protein 3 [Chlorella desiccata (nom. nud.)]